MTAEMSKRRGGAKKSYMYLRHSLRSPHQSKTRRSTHPDRTRISLDLFRLVRTCRREVHHHSVVVQHEPPKDSSHIFSFDQFQHSSNFTMFKAVLSLALVASAGAFAPSPAFTRPSTSLFMSAELEAKVKGIIVEQLGVDAENVINTASFIDDLGADSLDTVELIMAIEEEFDTEIPEEEAASIATVQDAIDFVTKL